MLGVSRPRRCCATPNSHIFNKEAKTFGISGEATFDYGAAFDRSRKVADGRVAACTS